MSELDETSPKSTYFVRRETASFQSATKPTPSTLNITGTRPSLQNNQLLLTPIGIPSIDHFLGIFVL